MGRHDRRAQDLVGALLDMHSREPFILAVENCAINLVEPVGVGFDLDAFLPCILLIHPNMRNFRLREGTPWHIQGFDAGIAEAEGMWK